jgi:hypothetical protein
MNGHDHSLLFLDGSIDQIFAQSPIYWSNAIYVINIYSYCYDPPPPLPLMVEICPPLDPTIDM